jgi:coenzyme PQQ precursor peptide PqqA
VIVGPAPTNYDRTRKGPVFLSRIGAPDRRARVGVCPRGIAVVGTITHSRGRLHDGQSRLTLAEAFSPAGARPAAQVRERPMAWTTPTLVEICVGLEINGYLPAEF